MANWRFNRVLSALLLFVIFIGFGVWKLTAAPETNVSPPLVNNPSSIVVGEGGIGFIVDPPRSEARYRVREQLAGMSLFQDAVGVTKSIEGGVTFDEDGSILPESSGINIDLTTLTSDESRRDNFVRRNTLQTDRFSTAAFVPREIQGLPFPLPTEGFADVKIIADLTIRGITKRQEWPATIEFERDAMTVRARHSFPFGDFDMVPPRVAIVLSVDDEIRLEADIRLIKSE